MRTPRLRFSFEELPIAIDRRTIPMLFHSPRPEYGYAFDLLRFRQAEQQAPVGRRQETPPPLGETGQPAAARFNDHLGADDVAMVLTKQFDSQPMTVCEFLLF